MIHSVGQNRCVINTGQSRCVVTHQRAFSTNDSVKSHLYENITGEDVAQLALSLLGDGAKRVTGGTHYVDSGVSIMDS